MASFNGNYSNPLEEANDHQVISEIKTETEGKDKRSKNNASATTLLSKQAETNDFKVDPYFCADGCGPNILLGGDYRIIDICDYPLPHELGLMLPPPGAVEVLEAIDEEEDEDLNDRQATKQNSKKRKKKKKRKKGAGDEEAIVNQQSSDHLILDAVRMLQVPKFLHSFT